MSLLISGYRSATPPAALRSRSALLASQPPPAQPSPEEFHAADHYQPSQGVQWARKVGAVKRRAAQGALLGVAGLAVAGAVVSSALGAGILLAGGALAAYGVTLLSPAKTDSSQQPEASELYHQTLETVTDSMTRRANFDRLEESLQAPDLQTAADGRTEKGSRKVQIRTSAAGLKFLWKGAESGKSLRRNVPGNGENGRERAAYLVDKRLGHYARVPPTVQRSLAGEDGVATMFVDKASWADDAMPWLLKKKDAEAYRRVAIFDNIIGNLDRHSRNALLTQEGRTVPIDHGLAFPVKNGFQGMSINYNFSKKIDLSESERGMLEGFLQQRTELSQELSSCLEPEAITAMFDRVTVMLDKGATSDGWRWTLG